MIIPLAVLVITAIAHGFFLRDTYAGQNTMYLGLGGTYVALAGYALWRMWDDGSLRDRLMPRGGDITYGALLAGLLLLASWGVRQWLTGPGTGRQDWLIVVQNQTGEDVEKNALSLILLLLIPALQEIVWRGLVLHEVEHAVGNRRGWLVTTLLFTASYLPTVYTMKAPFAGYNPLLALAAFGAGMVWTFFAFTTRRLPPVMISASVFVYFSANQFHIPDV